MGATAERIAVGDGRTGGAARVGFGGMSDETLARLVSGGNRIAFSTLYERYRVPLSRYCRSILQNPDDAADAFQNAMIKALAALERELPSGPLRPWLYRIAHNESIEIIRKRMRACEDLVAETPDFSDINAPTDVADQLQALFADLRELPERQRGALLMRELAGLEYEQIGRVFETSSVAARKLVYEARVTLSTHREGRAADCDQICRQLSDGDGRTARAKTIKAHLATCEACSAFERSLRTRREQFALIPALPLIGGGAWLATTLGGGAGATKGAIAGGGAVAGSAVAGTSVLTAGAGAGAGATSAGVLSGLGGAVAVKCLTVCGALVVAGAGAAIATSGTHHSAAATHQLASVATASVAHSASHASHAIAQAASAQADSHVAGSSAGHGAGASSHSGSSAGAQHTSQGATLTFGRQSAGHGAGSLGTPKAATGSGTKTPGSTKTSTGSGSTTASGGTGTTGTSGTSSSGTTSASTGSGTTSTTTTSTPTGTSSGTTSSGTTNYGYPGGTSATATGGDSASTDTDYTGIVKTIIASSETEATTQASTMASGIENLVSSMLGAYGVSTSQSGTSTGSSSTGNPWFP